MSNNINSKSGSTKGITFYLKKWLTTGVLFCIPLVLTIYIVLYIISFFDDLIIGNFFADSMIANIPGLGVVVSFVFLIIIGFIASNFFGQMFFNIGERILHKLPFVRSIYSTLKQLFSTILSSGSKSFREVVLVEYPRKGIWCLAFVTSRDSGEIQNKTEEELISIFLPTTPNPTSGFLLFIPEKDIIKLDMTPDVAMKIIISAGTINSANVDNYIKE